MNIWLIIAIAIVAIVVVAVVLDEVFCLIDCDIVPFAGLCALILEGLAYGFYKLVPWVMSWNTDMVVKISFMAVPILLIALIASASICQGKRQWIPWGNFFFFLMSGIVCATFAWISSTGWRIGVISVFSIPMIIAECAIIWEEINPHGGYGYGDHCEVVSTYGLDSRSFEEGQQPWVM